jgi:predicted tellurium resistance membrane protein TerC
MIALLKPQTFNPQDVLILLILFAVELFLSADNILAISLILNRIDPSKRGISLMLGVGSSLFFRAIIILFAAVLFLLDFLKVIGGIYLIYISFSHIFHIKKKVQGQLPSISLLRGIISIELTDILFALDSIFIVLGLLSFFYTKTEVESKIWVAYVGGVLGVITLRFFASSLLKFLNKHPIIEKICYYLIAWLGIKLIFIGFSLSQHIAHFDTFFSIGILFIIIFSFFSTKWSLKR